MYFKNGIEVLKLTNVKSGCDSAYSWAAPKLIQITDDWINIRGEGEPDRPRYVPDLPFHTFRALKSTNFVKCTNIDRHIWKLKIVKDSVGGKEKLLRPIIKSFH